MSARIRLGALVFSAAAATFVLAGGASALPGSVRSRPDLPSLFRQAERIVRHAGHGTFARALVYEADGLPRGGQCSNGGCTAGRPTHRAAGIVSWRFVFQNATPHSRYASATIVYTPRGFGHVVGHVQPFLEDVAIPRPPRMTVARAVHLIRRAGHTRAFVSVTLRNPLGPKRSNPLYIFGMSTNKFVAVDTRTGRVSSLS